jgi:CRP-like cAMP-binding protein
VPQECRQLDEEKRKGHAGNCNIPERNANDLCHGGKPDDRIIAQHRTEAADRSWSVVETLPTPMVLGLDVLYGRARVHQFSAYARSSTRLLTIDKHTVAALTGYFEVFRINVLNALTTTIAQQRQPLWTPAAATLEGRIVEFLRQHVLRPAGHKIFRISMRTLGAYLGEDQRYVSMAAHRIERRGLIQLRRSAIQVPAFESLIQAKL